MFKKKVFLSLLILSLSLAGLSYWVLAGSSVDPMVSEGKMIVHTSPFCGCCKVFANYYKRLGYDVDLNITNDLFSIKQSLEIPRELESCHTSEIEGYVVEGHVPVEAINKLLTTRPDIKGIGMGGMPSGSPGMPGPKEAFLIYEITHEGEKGELFLIL